LDQIIRALQQYKDAKPCTLYLTYSTGMVNPSIFGLKRTMDGFLGVKTKGKPLGMRDLLKPGQN
jgi:hypothetical protein